MRKNPHPLFRSSKKRFNEPILSPSESGIIQIQESGSNLVLPPQKVPPEFPDWNPTHNAEVFAELRYIQEESTKDQRMAWVFDTVKKIEVQQVDMSEQPDVYTYSKDVDAWIQDQQTNENAGRFPAWFNPRLTRKKVKHPLHKALSDVLEDPELHRALLTFMEDNEMTPVLDFLGDVQDYKRIRHAKTRDAAAKGIYDRHIDPSSKRSIRLGYDLQFSLRKQIYQEESLSDDLFDESYEQVYITLERGDFFLFLHSPAYENTLPEEVVEKFAAEKDAMQETWTHTNQWKSLHADIVRGKDLRTKDARRKPDSFCVITVGSKSYRTQTERSSCDPEYQCHFQVPIFRTSQFIKVSVYDNNVLGTRELIGQATILLCDITYPWVPHRCILLTEDGDAIAGEIFIRFSLSMEEANDTKEAIFVDAVTSSAMSDIVRGKVSKKKKRFVDDGFNLDLTYITDHIIAMGFPSVSIEGLYRNNMKDVQRFFNTRHPDHYMIYNLCSERNYNEHRFGGRVKNYGFDDHNPCAFNLIPEFCKDVEAFLSESPLNVVSIHCKAGKGRTGLMTSCYLLHSKAYKTAEGALTKFATERTKNKKGVTIPSQIRYTHYFEHFLRSESKDPTVFPIPTQKAWFLQSITIYNPPPTKNNKIFLQVRTPTYKYNSKNATLQGIVTTENQEEAMYFDVYSNTKLPLENDVQFTFHTPALFKLEKLFSFWMNTRFIDPSTKMLQLQKTEIDKAVKDKKHKAFSSNLRIRVDFVETDLYTAAEALASARSHAAIVKNKTFTFSKSGDTELEESKDVV